MGVLGGQDPGLYGGTIWRGVVTYLGGGSGGDSHAKGKFLTQMGNEAHDIFLGGLSLHLNHLIGS